MVSILNYACGFRPVLGNGSYGKYGTTSNQYSLDKPEGNKRILFIGDSVTARMGIFNALKSLYSSHDNIEFWNAGVESFNSIQEINYYIKYNSKIKPDCVLMTFVLNDFETTPIAFRNQAGEMEVFALKQPNFSINPVLFKNIYLYRLYVGLTGTLGGKRDEIIDETYQKIEALNNLLKKDSIRFIVVISPTLKTYDSWSDKDKSSHSKALQLFTDLDIEHYDLLEVLEKGIQNNIDVYEHAGDYVHPAKSICNKYGKYLYDKKIFDSYTSKGNN